MLRNRSVEELRRESFEGKRSELRNALKRINKFIAALSTQQNNQNKGESNLRATKSSIEDTYFKKF